MCANGREFARISTHPLVLLGFELWLGGDCVLYLTLLGYLPGVIFAAVVICCKDLASVRQNKNNYATCGGTAQTPLDLVRKTARLTTGGGSFGNLMKSGLWKKVDKVPIVYDGIVPQGWSVQGQGVGRGLILCAARDRATAVVTASRGTAASGVSW
jgi:hypothetical protein